MNWLSGGSTLGFKEILSLLGSIIIVVLFLIGLYFLSRWTTKKINLKSFGKHIKILEKVSLGQNMHLLIIEINKKYYLISAGDKNVQLITELEGLDDFDETHDQAPVSFKNVFSEFLNKNSLFKNIKKGEDEKE